MPATPEEQLSLGLNVQGSAPVAPVAVKNISYSRTESKPSNEKVTAGRMILPADLPLEKVFLEPVEDVMTMIVQRMLKPPKA